jgi:hypothetical protein
MPQYAEQTPFPIEKFLTGFYYSNPKNIPPPTAAVYPSSDFVYDEGMIRARPGDAVFSTTVLSGRPQIATDWVDGTGTRHLFVLTTTNLYHYDPNTQTFASYLGGLHGTPAIVPRAVSFFGQLLFCNGVDTLITANATSASLISGAPVGQALAVFGGRVLLGNITQGTSQYPTMVKWSNTLDPTNWTTGSAGSVQLDRDDDFVMGMTTYRGQLIVARRKSIDVASLLPLSPYYDFEKLVEGVGTPAGASLAPTPLGLMFLGDDNLYLISGTTPQPVGAGARVFIQNLNQSVWGRSVSAVNASMGRVYLAVPYGSATDLSDVLVYNYQEGHVSRFVKSNLTGLGTTMMTAPLTWASMTGTWQSYTITWGELGAFQAAPRTLYLRSDGYVYAESLVPQDMQGTTPASYTMTHLSPLLTPGGQTPQGDPTPSIVEYVEVVTRPVSAQLTAQLGWSTGTDQVTFAAAVTKNVSSGRALFAFPTREAPYWQVQLQATTPNAPQIVRLVLWVRRRRSSLA